jgi:exosortase
MIKFLRYQGRLNVVCSVAIFVTLLFFYGLYRAFAEGHGATGFVWLAKIWLHPNNELQHAWLIPLLSGFLVFRAVREKNARTIRPSNLGLGIVALGLLFYLASVRVLQPRLMIGSLPIIGWGTVLYLYGWSWAFRLSIPIFLICLAVPVPGLLQATNQLQVYATGGAHGILGLVGIPTNVSGNFLRAPDDSWGFDIAEGCSGIRSLMALSLIAAVYADLTLKALWQKGVLFALSIPLAVVANILRVSSIVVVAKFVDAEIAGTIYHDFSGFIFFPIGLLGLVLCSKLLSKMSRRGSAGKTVVRHIGGNNETRL